MAIEKEKALYELILGLRDILNANINSIGNMMHVNESMIDVVSLAFDGQVLTELKDVFQTNYDTLDVTMDSIESVQQFLDFVEREFVSDETVKAIDETSDPEMEDEILGKERTQRKEKRGEVPCDTF